MGWVASVLILAGNWLIGSKKRAGFLMVAIGSMIWMFIALVGLNRFDLAVINAFAVIFMMRGWFKWGK